jgi:hypothetical protein
MLALERDVFAEVEAGECGRKEKRVIRREKEGRRVWKRK